MTNFVQMYSSADANGPSTITGVAGNLTTMLDMVLTSNYNTAGVTSITESGTTYNVVLAVANATLLTGNYVVISGASPAGANGTWPITVTDSTHFSYVGPGSLGSITGTILYAKAGLGWSKPWSKTNVSVYQSSNTNGGAYPTYCLRVDDSNTIPTAGGAKEAAVRGWESMTSVDDFSQPGFPTVAQQTNGLCWRKSADTGTARSWWIIGDNRFFFLVINSDNSTTVGRGLYYFGAVDSYKSGEATGCVLSGSSTFNTGSIGVSAGGLCVNAIGGTLTTSTGIYMARSYSGAGGSIAGGLISNVQTAGLTLGIGNSNNSNITYPYPVDGGMLTSPIFFGESAASGPRARLPGAFNHMHSTIPCNDGDLVTNVLGLSGVTLQMLSLSTSTGAGSIFIDKFGPW